ncbi:alpha/beta hydrolase [Oryzomicrobium sp.]|uniref:alpha/beta fold hydrolase n=1 Tax=Oryzomicrobium sp. TaxID=1911578 RepID=UPI0025FDEF92|nr:alpha/beta hydrolase [Oryzomicrobium sp.]MCE1242719.1 alpha/beta hydrolase [Oryzomicrobium sp.]
MKVDTNISARTLRVAVRDLELEVGCWSPAGAPAGADLVLLHEGLGSLSLWRDFPEQLAAATDRRVWAWSRQGYGASGHDPVPRTPDYLEIEARDWLPATLVALGIERPVLVGHSDGGSIALLHGLLFPGAQAGVIAIAPHSWVEEESLAGIRIAGQSWRDSLGKAGGFQARLARHHGDADRVFSDWHDTWLSPPFRHWDIRSRLHTIACPTLAVQGRQDEYATLGQIEVVRDSVPGAEMAVIEDCGHSPHREQPAALIAILRTFLAGKP